MKTSTKLTPALKLGRELHAARKSQGLSQEALAELVGTRQPVISRYERGAAIPSSRHLSELIHRLHLDAEEVYDLVRRHYADDPKAAA